MELTEQERVSRISALNALMDPDIDFVTLRCLLDFVNSFLHFTLGLSLILASVLQVNLGLFQMFDCFVQ